MRETDRQTETETQRKNEREREGGRERELCMYHRMCVCHSMITYSCFNLNTDNLVSSPSSPPGWKEHTLSPLTLPDTPADSEGCHTRPCGVQEVCVPSPGEGPGYKCLLMPASCGSPPSVPHATHMHSTTSQGDLATLQCVQSYVASPYQIPVDRQCQVEWIIVEEPCAPPLLRFLVTLTQHNREVRMQTFIQQP